MSGLLVSGEPAASLQNSCSGVRLPGPTRSKAVALREEVGASAHVSHDTELTECSGGLFFGALDDASWRTSPTTPTRSASVRSTQML